MLPQIERFELHSPDSQFPERKGGYGTGQPVTWQPQVSTIRPAPAGSSSSASTAILSLRMVVPKSKRAPYAVAPTPRSPRHRKPQTKPQSGCHSTYPASSLSFDACNTSLSILNGFIPNPLEYDSIRPCRRGLHPQLPMLSTPGHRCPGRCQNGVFIGVLIVPHAARSRASTLRLAARHRHGTAPRTHARLPGRRRLPDRKPPAVRPTAPTAHR